MHQHAKSMIIREHECVCCIIYWIYLCTFLFSRIRMDVVPFSGKLLQQQNPTAVNGSSARVFQNAAHLIRQASNGSGIPLSDSYAKRLHPKACYSTSLGSVLFSFVSSLLMGTVKTERWRNIWTWRCDVIYVIYDSTIGGGILSTSILITVIFAKYFRTLVWIISSKSKWMISTACKSHRSAL